MNFFLSWAFELISCFFPLLDDFVPASIDPNKTSAVDFGYNGKVTITMPNVEGSGTTESVYQGQHKPHQKECVLIIDNETGDITLERLNQGMIVKKARLRQEDLTGKSLALNKGLPLPPPPVSFNGSNNSQVAGISTSQSKEKRPASLKTNGSSGPKMAKHSPPISNGTSSFSSKPKTSTTPSPPSMPIFSANTGSLVHLNGNSANNIHSDMKSTSTTTKKKTKTNGKYSQKLSASKSNKRLNRLSEESSSESSDQDDSDAESSSSQSSDSSSEEEEKCTTKVSTNTNRSSALSMPSLSMPSLVPPSNPAITTNSSEKPKRPGYSLSEDSDSSDGEIRSKNRYKSGQITTSTITETKAFPDSMPTFTNGNTAAASVTSNATTITNYSSMPKFGSTAANTIITAAGHPPETKLSQLSK